MLFIQQNTNILKEVMISRRESMLAPLKSIWHLEQKYNLLKQDSVSTLYFSAYSANVRTTCQEMCSN